MEVKELSHMLADILELAHGDVKLDGRVKFFVVDEGDVATLRTSKATYSIYAKYPQRSKKPFDVAGRLSLEIESNDGTIAEGPSGAFQPATMYHIMAAMLRNELVPLPVPAQPTA